MDGKFPVDSSGTLPNGKSFSTPGGDADDAEDAIAGVRPLPDREDADILAGPGSGSAYDRRTVDEINRKLAAAGYQFQSLDSRRSSQSLPFQARRGEEVRTERHR